MFSRKIISESFMDLFLYNHLNTFLYTLYKAEFWIESASQESFSHLVSRSFYGTVKMFANLKRFTPAGLPELFMHLNVLEALFSMQEKKNIYRNHGLDENNFTFYWYIFYAIICVFLRSFKRQ